MATTDQKSARWEAVKEFLRLVVFGAIGGGIAAAAVAVNLIHDPIIATAVAAFIAYIGKAWDKYVHKTETTDATGVLPF